jgi:uncharacterized membrane protein YqjE
MSTHEPSTHAGGTRTDGEHPPFEEASLGDLLGRLSDDVTLLFRQEVELAKLELKHELSVASKAAAFLAGGVIVALFAVLLLAMAASWGLAEVMAPGLAFLIVGLVIAVIAAVSVATGRKRMQQVDATPRRTIDTLQRDRDEISERISR